MNSLLRLIKSKTLTDVLYAVVLLSNNLCQKIIVQNFQIDMVHTVALRIHISQTHSCHRFGCFAGLVRAGFLLQVLRYSGLSINIQINAKNVFLTKIKLGYGVRWHTLLWPFSTLLFLSSPSLCRPLSVSRSLSLRFSWSLSRSLWESRVLTLSLSLSLSFSLSRSLSLSFARPLSLSLSRLLSLLRSLPWSCSLRWCLWERSRSLWCSFSPSLCRLSCSLGWSGSFCSLLPLRSVILLFSYNSYHHKMWEHNERHGRVLKILFGFQVNRAASKVKGLNR